ncbi:hypothetical protein GCM10009557_50270 [Virgisporangium ochraceum]|uniref:Uncharacterized protein n=1 Tax=Virgisporangium ochraceum TaxID=65505 RepID=A0A8J3ZRE9_9ACTN|nr:hypothetical protein [Virgisporangium ochraceum]GIJ66945.1 hypothetical protein Voc01_018620 [Virgisporangium ochraceum]
MHRRVSRAGAGGLYALVENNRPADNLLLPLKLNTVTQPSPRGGQRPADVSKGELTVTVPNMSATSGYHLRIQLISGVPAYQQRHGAENASIFRANRFGSSSASAGRTSAAPRATPNWTTWSSSSRVRGRG